MSFQMGPLSALERFLCIGFALRAQTHVHATHVCAQSSFHASVTEGTRRTERSERGADNSELRTRQSHLLAEVLHLINGSRLHCALNHAQIKKLVIFKINGGRGQSLDGRILSPVDFVTPAQLPSSLPPPPLPLWCFPPCRPTSTPTAASVEPL